MYGTIEARDRHSQTAFASRIIANAHVEGCGQRVLVRGPAGSPPAGIDLVDIPNDRPLRFDDTDASVSISASRRTPMATASTAGRLVTCEHLTRQVTRTEHDGAVTVGGSFDGMQLNCQMILS